MLRRELLARVVREENHERLAEAGRWTQMLAEHVAHWKMPNTVSLREARRLMAAAAAERAEPGSPEKLRAVAAAAAAARDASQVVERGVAPDWLDSCLLYTSPSPRDRG